MNRKLFFYRYVTFLMCNRKLNRKSRLSVYSPFPTVPSNYWGEQKGVSRSKFHGESIKTSFIKIYLSVTEQRLHFDFPESGNFGMVQNYENIKCLKLKNKQKIFLHIFR
uniref:Uncharacterized protein n=1 Tax=Cacopsylla melanoneura TaxID=428564 RepID=A0A8D9E7N7_9HEMI